MKIDRAGYPFIAAALVPAAALAAARRYGWSTGFALLGGFLTYFFRDPERQIPQDPGLVVSPADGRIMIAGPGDRRWAPPGDWQQITIFLSPLDVHINRTPVAGRITRVDYRPGQFLPAFDERSNDNELNEVWVDHDGRTVVFRQVVGILARRIVCRVAEGEQVARGDRIGLMKFGSRMDVFLPIDAQVRVQVGDRVIGGETVLAILGLPMLGNLPLRRREDRPHRFRRGVYLLPSLFTVANLFCGYACVVYATRADFDTAALFIGIAMVLDTLDGLIARLTNSSSAFGVQLDSLADVVSFGLAPAILAFTWGLWPLKRLGWAAGFIYVTAAAMRLARFNIQTTTATDKRHFVGLPSPAAGAVIASTVYLFPFGLQEPRAALPALAMVLVPAFLMVSTIRFRSVKAVDMGWQRSYLVVLPVALALALIASHPRLALVIMSYSYVTFAFVMWGAAKLGKKHAGEAGLIEETPDHSLE